MSNSIKNAIYTLLLIGLVFGVWKWRSVNEEKLVKGTITGATMGTTYYVIVFGEPSNKLKQELDSILIEFNKSMSTYDSMSAISRFNQSDSIKYSDPWFYPVLVKSREVHRQTNGTFDPTVMPLVQIWGFGPDERLRPDSVLIDSVRRLVDFEQVDFDISGVRKRRKGLQLDFSAIAKGYAVDVLSDFLMKRGYENHFVEIGGEVKVRGTNIAQGSRWRIGIVDPESGVGEEKKYGILEIEDKAVATSGNYRNYYVEDGIMYSHTIDPDSGYPVRKHILSATIVAGDCMTADAWATACMVMGHEEAIILMEKNGLEGILLYSGSEGKVESYISPSLSGFFRKVTP